jgi:hypothetical protein
MSERAMEYARLASTLVGLLMCFACWRWKNIGRLLFVVLFVWAGQINLRTALSNPTDYLNYARLAPVAAYRDFILGPFARHIAWFVVPVALGQLAIALFIALRGEAVRLGLAGAGLFLLAIVPLGIGSGFPAPLVMASAAGLLWRFDYPASLPVEIQGWVQRVWHPKA